MARTKVVMISAGVEALFMSDAMSAMLVSTAEPVASRAASSAPRASGEYAESIEVRATTASALGIQFKFGGDRAAAIVVATAPHSRIVEARTGNLARALGDS